MIEYNKYAPYTELQKNFIEGLPKSNSPSIVTPKPKPILDINASAKCFSLAEAIVVRDCFLIMLPHSKVRVREILYLDTYIVEAYTILKPAF